MPLLNGNGVSTDDVPVPVVVVVGAVGANGAGDDDIDDDELVRRVRTDVVVVEAGSSHRRVDVTAVAAAPIEEPFLMPINRSISFYGRSN